MFVSFGIYTTCIYTVGVCVLSLGCSNDLIWTGNTRLAVLQRLQLEHTWQNKCKKCFVSAPSAVRSLFPLPSLPPLAPEGTLRLALTCANFTCGNKVVCTDYKINLSLLLLLIKLDSFNDNFLCCMFCFSISFHTIFPRTFPGYEYLYIATWSLGRSTFNVKCFYHKFEIVFSKHTVAF